MIRRFLKSLREYKKPTILCMLSMVGEVVMETFIPYMMANLIDVGFANGNMPYILKMGLILVLFALISLSFGLLGAFLSARAGTGFAKNLRGDMYRRLQSFSFENMDHFSTSSLITRLTTDITNVQNTFTMCIRLAIRTPMIMIFSIVMTFFISWKMALIMLATLPILMGGFLLIAKNVFPVFIRVFKTYDRLNNTVQENLHGIRVVKSYVREDFETEKFQKTSEDIYTDFSIAEKILSWISPMMMGLSYLSILLIAFVGAYMIIGSEATTVQIMGDVFTPGLLNSVISYTMQVLMSCMGLSMVFVMIMMSRESMRRIDEVLLEEPTVVNPLDGVREVKDGSIVFKNVSFSYAKDKSRYCLSDVNFAIESGQTVGIIGGTGSSKSTLVQLIPRLYEASEGEVLVGGVPVENYDLKALRDEVSVVLQKNLLFSGTIKENLRWGNENASDEEIVEACKLAQADGFIREFPEGYDTMITQGGSNVSGGQRQRLCIARALLKKPKVLILDDSTSAVDTATDAKIRQGLKQYVPETTKLIIAQRISSVQDADMIIVLEGGKVNGIGNHETLMKENTIYREVYESQQKGGKADE